MSSPTVRSVSAGSATAGGAVSLGQPAGMMPGDRLVAFQFCDWDSAADMTATGDFQVAAARDDGVNAAHSIVWEKVATEFEPVTFDFDGGVDSDKSVTLFALAGVDPDAVLSIGHAGGTTDPPTAPGVTAVGAESLLLAAVGGEAATATVISWEPPAGMVERSDTQSSAHWQSCASASAHLTTGGDTGGRVFTPSAALATWHAWSVAAPASAASPNPPKNDEFSGSIDPAWVEFSPVGDVAVTATASTVRFDVPAGVSHDEWVAETNGRKLLQPVSGDFALDTKVSVLPAADYSMAGLYVLGSDGSRVLLDLRYFGGLEVACASFDSQNGGGIQGQDPVSPGGRTAIYLRLRRAGDTFTALHSWDGMSWAEVASFVHAIPGARAGIWAGNAGGLPAYSPEFDYARWDNDAGSSQGRAGFGWGAVFLPGSGAGMPPGVAPVVDAGPDLGGAVGDAVSIVASGSDADGSVVAWSWRFAYGPDTPTLSGASTATLTFTPTSPGDYAFYVKCADDTGRWSVEDGVNVTVAPDPGGGSLLFLGDFSTGDTSQYLFELEEPDPGPSSIVVYDAGSVPSGSPPPRGGFTHAAAFNTADASGTRVRSQVQTDAMFYEGDEVYIGWSTWFPAGFPEIHDSDGNWFVFMSSFGAPFNGSSNNTMSCYTESDGVTYIEHRYRTGHKLWKMPLVTGQWVDFVRRTKYSKDPGVGFHELWVNGVQQTYAPVSGTPSEVSVASGGARVYLSTLVPDASGGYEFHLTNYRKAGLNPGTVTVCHAAARVGTAFASVDPAAG